MIFSYKFIYINYVFPISSSLTILCNVLLFIINPGIIYSGGKNNNEEKIYCSECKFFYPSTNKKMEHCFECGVCVTNLDHHCDVIGKCVGKYNTCIFVLFTITITCFMICSVIIFSIALIS